MKVLLLHPEDKIPESRPSGGWDLIVDLGRAPVSIYKEWSRHANGPVISIFDFAEEIEDLHRTRELLQLGMGRVVDGWGIDWWDVLGLFVASDLQQMMLIHRLAKQIGSHCELYSTRSDPRAFALQNLLDIKLVNLRSGFSSVLGRVRRYSERFSQLNVTQLAQILQDKFDRGHKLRQLFNRRRPHSEQPVILLPSAYVNVSRTAVSYAASMPDDQFLLVCARNSAGLKSLPENVQSATLDAYFTSPDKHEINSLLESWRTAQQQLSFVAPEFGSAIAVSALGQISSLIRWGVAVRDAWTQVFDTENIVGCLCADDSNPYTRIPLILAKKKQIPSIACHHGALDSWMAMKTPHADFYLAKGEMERDYLVHTCRVSSQQIIIGAPEASNIRSFEAPDNLPDRPWMVFFTEPYHAAAWRTDEVYRELLPRLSALVKACGLKLVFKLHPFESVEGHRRLLRRHLSKEEVRQIEVIAEVPSAELWSKARFALTGQSTVAVECSTRGIPVFLCAWLRDSYTGYIQQYTRYGIGQVLESAEEVSNIPQLLETEPPERLIPSKLRQTIDPEKLRELLCGTCPLPVAAHG